MVEARFVCTHKGEPIVNEATGVEGRNINLNADAEDPIFKVFTPGGMVSMQIVGSAADQFEVGKKYRVLFDEIVVEAAAIDISPVSSESPAPEKTEA
jgi:hypothetical protein